MSGKSQTIGDFTFCRPSQILPINQIIATSLSQRRYVYVWEGTGAQQFRGLVVSEIYRRRPRRYKFEFSFVGNDRRPSQKSGTRRENRNAPDSPDLSPDDRGYRRFRVFISRQNLQQLRETVKSPIAWDFPDIWKPGLKILKDNPFGLASRLSRKFHFNRLYIIYIFNSLQTTKLKLMSC